MILPKSNIGDKYHPDMSRMVWRDGNEFSWGDMSMTLLRRSNAECEGNAEGIE